MCHHSDKGWAHTHSVLVRKYRFEGTRLKLMHYTILYAAWQCKITKVTVSDQIYPDDNSPDTSNTNVQAVRPGMEETSPLLALQVYSPASDTCTTERINVA